MLYGSFGLFIRSLQEHFSTLQQVFVRCFGAFVVALILITFLVPKSERQAIFQTKVLLFGLIFPFSIFLWTNAVTMGTVNLAVFGLYVGALITSPLLSKFLFKEEISKEVLYGLLLALVGVALFCVNPDEKFNSTALCLSIGAGIFQSISLCYRRWLGQVNRLAVVFVQSLGGLIVISNILLFYGLSMFPSVGAVPYYIGFSYGALVVLISYLLLVGSQNLEIAKGNIILSTELVWATILAILFLKEKPTLFQIIGSGFLLLAITMTIPKQQN